MYNKALLTVNDRKDIYDLLLVLKANEMLNSDVRVNSFLIDKFYNILMAYYGDD